MQTSVRPVLNKFMRAAWLACPLLALASPPPDEPLAVLERLRATYRGTAFAEVRQTPVAGVYEVVMGQKVAYTEASGRYFFFGNLVDLQSQANLTEERTSELTKVDPGALPLNQAIKTVYGAGSRVVYVFEDPQCGYCKKLKKTLHDAGDLTVYTFLYPVLGPKSATLAESLWCSSDSASAWTSYMLGGQEPVAARCDNPLSSNMKLGQSLGITGTPTLVFPDGRKVAGAVSLEQLDRLLGQRSTPVAKSDAK